LPLNYETKPAVEKDNNNIAEKLFNGNILSTGLVFCCAEKIRFTQYLLHRPGVWTKPDMAGRQYAIPGIFVHKYKMHFFIQIC